MSLDLACGGVVVNAQGEVLLREPSGHFGGYVWTWPKGRPDAGESPEAAALREVREETGVEAEIIRPIPGEFRGDRTTTRFWLMRLVRVVGSPDRETSAIRWVPLDAAAALLARSHSPRGRKRDLEILAAARAALEVP